MSVFDIFKKLDAEKASASKLPPITHLIVGLGNPGNKYALTRHNAGFIALEYVSQRLGIKIDRLKFKAMSARVRFVLPDGRDCSVLLMCPQTFMNLSGDAVREAADFYKIPPSNIIVIFDDVSLPCGKLRIRRSGSDGGQKGMRDIILKLNTDAIPRIKLGIGEKPHPEMDLADYVLSKFNKAEQESLYCAIERAYDALPLMLSGDIDGAMARFN